MFNKYTDIIVEMLICGELRTAKEQHGENFNSLHEAYAVALEELEEASVDFENVKTAFSYFWEDITANDDPTNDLIDAKHYTVEAIKELETVEIVRCKDCKYYTNNIDDNCLRDGFCCLKEVGLFCKRKADDYCSRGELE